MRAEACWGGSCRDGRAERLDALRAAAARQTLRAKVPAREGERWRSPPGFSRYEVSDQGRVRGPSGLCQPFRKNRQLVVKIARDSGVRESHELGRLVLTAFGAPIGRYGVVRHRDGNPENFRLDNLVWTTRRAHLEEAKGAVLEALRAGKTHQEAADLLGLSRSAIYRIVHGARLQGDQEALATKARRYPITPSERALVLDALHSGASYEEAARRAGVSFSSVSRISQEAQKRGELELGTARRAGRTAVQSAVLEALRSGVSREDVAARVGVSVRTIHRIVSAGRACA